MNYSSWTLKTADSLLDIYNHLRGNTSILKSLNSKSVKEGLQLLRLALSSQAMPKHLSKVAGLSYWLSGSVEIVMRGLASMTAIPSAMKVLGTCDKHVGLVWNSICTKSSWQRQRTAPRSHDMESVECELNTQNHPLSWRYLMTFVLSVFIPSSL